MFSHNPLQLFLVTGQNGDLCHWSSTVPGSQTGKTAAGVQRTGTQQYIYHAASEVVTALVSCSILSSTLKMEAIKKAELSLCLIKHYAMKAYGRVDV
jgi:hypothetical protein